MIRLLTGENEFALSEENGRVVAEFLQAHDAFGLERLDGEEVDLQKLRDALLQLPFLVSKKLVVIKNVFAAKQLQEQLLDLVPQVPDEVDVLLIDPKSDKRTKLYKELSAKKVVTEFVALKGSSLEKWIVDYATKKKGAISSEVAAYLVDRIGPEQMQLAREIEKLSVFDKITKELIDTHTEQALRGTVFDLLDKTFSGKIDEALKLYDLLLANKTDPAEILALIAWQLQVFALIKYAGAGTPVDVSKLTGVHSFVVGKALNVVRTMTVDDVKQAVSKALEADIAIKTTPVDSVDVVRVLLLDLSSS